RATRVLYDALKMHAPPVDVPWSQRSLDEELGGVRLRRAIVVSSPKLAYLARLAFGDGDYRVFYDDVDAALRWLGEPSACGGRSVRSGFPRPARAVCSASPSLSRKRPRSRSAARRFPSPAAATGPSRAGHRSRRWGRRS